MAFSESTLHSSLYHRQSVSFRSSFCLTVRLALTLFHRYSAAKELAEFIKHEQEALEASKQKGGRGKAANGDVGEGEDPAEAERSNSHLRALTAGKVSEDVQNAAANAQRTGDPVRFGDQIQLQHVNSGECKRGRKDGPL